jgi:hypothetical protein
MLRYSAYNLKGTDFAFAAVNSKEATMHSKES